MEGVMKIKLSEFNAALFDFGKSLDVDASAFDEAVGDLIRRGKVQKFEICTELLWKTMKVFLFENYGVDLASPKPIMKSFYSNGLCGNEEYECMLEIIDERNRLSHLYRKEMILPLLEKLSHYYTVMRKAADSMR